MAINKSQDGFTNLEEAPVPKDNFEETLKNSFQNNNNYVGVPTNNYRRASTSRDDSFTEQPSKMSRNPSMNMQDAIHVRRLSTEIKADDFVDDILDKSEKTNTANTKPDTYSKSPVTFKEKYNDNTSQQPPNAEHPLRRRESSFQYEDYKKEMYDRVGF